MPSPLHTSESVRLDLSDVRQLSAELFWRIARRTSQQRRDDHDPAFALIARFVEDEAWIDAALALIAADLPKWRIRRLVLDEGDWFCALSSKWMLPDSLDRPVEAWHPELALALLSAFCEARSMTSSDAGSDVYACA